MLRRTSDRARAASRVKVHLLVVAVDLVAVVAPAFVLVHGIGASRAQAAAAFRSSAPTAAGFVAGYLRSLEVAQARQASQHLSGPLLACDPPPSTPADGRADPAGTPFAELVDVLGLTEAAVFDPTGFPLAVFPCDFGVMDRTAGVARAVSTAAPSSVSNLEVTPDSSGREAVVEIATAYTSVGSNGRRVMVGGYPMSATPLATFLSDALVPHATGYLLDGSGKVLVGSHTAGGIPAAGSTGGGPALPAGTGAVTLSRADGSLARAASRATSGFYAGQAGTGYFASRTVSGSSWKVVVAIPESVLMATTTQGHALAKESIAYGAFVAAIAVATLFFYRYLAGRDRLAALSQELDLVARLDQLTGLYNRRHLDDHLGASVSLAHRHAHHLSLLMVDVDHFKRVNDTFGHGAGDYVLVEVARRMSGCLRPEDLIGRWGGEEFLVVLPMTDAAGAAEVAERIRHAVCVTPVEVEYATHLEVSVSIGAATAVGEHVDGDRLLRAADEGLYEAKHTGRNRVVARPGSLAQKTSVTPGSPSSP